MKSFSNTQQNPGPQIEWQTIELPNGEMDVSRGQFTIQLKRESLLQKKPFAAGIINPNVFQISVTFNLQSDPPRVIIAIGKINPADKRTYELPTEVSNGKFVVEWKDDKILQVYLNGKQLKWFVESQTVN